MPALPDPAVVTYPVTRHRWEGLLDAWLRRGYTGRAAGRGLPGNATAYGEAFAEELFRGDDPPDAIAAMSDELALGALRAASMTGRIVPDAVAITGWDDSDTAAFAGLTTLRQSLRDQGRRCARLVLGGQGAQAQAAQDPAGAGGVIRRATTRPGDTADRR